MAKRPPVFNEDTRHSKKRGWVHPIRKSTTARGYGWEWQKKRLRILERDKWLCRPCLKRGLTTLARDVDHIIPRSNRGSDYDDNLQSICVDCHKAKTAREGQAAQQAKQH